MSVKFYICERCGNEITFVKNSGVPVMCCGQKMKELVPGTVEASLEKHIPEYTVENNKVSVVVGSVEHPMIEAHYIEWIALETKEGVQIKHLKAEMAPKVEFTLTENDEVVAVYAYCNLHGLWVK